MAYKKVRRGVIIDFMEDKILCFILFCGNVQEYILGQTAKGFNA